MNERIKKDIEKTKHFVTVSIVSHGDSKKVIRLLSSICKFEQAKSIQVIVTDNLGHEIQEVDDAPWLSLEILRNEATLGFARNHNQAFQLATGKYFCILNPDVIFKEEIFHPLILLLENKQADIVAPRIEDSDTTLQDSYRKFPTPFQIIQRRLPGYRFSHPSPDTSGLVQPDWIAGIFMLMKSESYRNLNGFDEKYRLYFEDVDFCARAQLTGLKLLVDTNVHVQHNAQRSSRKKLIYLLWHIQSAFRFFSSPVYKEAKQWKKQSIHE
jgi:GT2 family glycosyltransferase